MEAAKTGKVIGTVEIILNNPKDARVFLTKASVIFKLKGEYKLERESLGKLKMLQRSLPDDLVEPLVDERRELEKVIPEVVSGNDEQRKRKMEKKSYINAKRGLDALRKLRGGR